MLPKKISSNNYDGNHPKKSSETATTEEHHEAPVIWGVTADPTPQAAATAAEDTMLKAVAVLEKESI